MCTETVCSHGLNKTTDNILHTDNVIQYKKRCCDKPRIFPISDGSFELCQISCCSYCLDDYVYKSN